MARTRFSMKTVVSVADVAVAQAALGKAKDPMFHQTLLLKRVVEVGQATCEELAGWLEANKGTLMDEAHRKPWDKYGNACHLRYFINRYRGAVKAVAPDGTPVAQTATKVRKPKAEAPATDGPAEEKAAEAAVERIMDETETQLASLELTAAAS